MIDAGYDLSKLKPNGSHYVAITFSAPYCLHLPEMNYEVSLGLDDQPRSVQIILQRKYRSISRRSLLPGVEQTEKMADRRGEYCYTSFIVYIPVRGPDAETHGDYSRMWKATKAKHSSFRQLAIKATNRLIAIYRLDTGECHIKPLAGHDAWFDYNFAFFFNKLPPTAGRSKFRGDLIPVYDIHDIVSSQPSIPEATVLDIQEKLVSDFQVPLADELLLNAHDFLDLGNYRLAVIEAETGFEAALFRYLRDLDNQIKNYQSPIKLIRGSPFKTLMKTKGKDFRSGSPRYKQWESKVWNIRGKLVHGQIQTVAPEVAQEAVQIVEDDLEYLLERPQTRPWRYG